MKYWRKQKMKLTPKQIETKTKIEFIANMFGIAPTWASAVAMVESALGEKQKSSTGCLGVFQMSSIAMEDLRLAMEEKDDELIDICCGVAFLRLLLKRWKSYQEATNHFCDPNDRYFYLNKVQKYMRDLKDI